MLVSTALSLDASTQYIYIVENNISNLSEFDKSWNYLLQYKQYLLTRR